MATLARTQAVVVTDRRRPGPDLFLTAAMVVLSGLGLLMVYTASRPLLTLQGDDPQGLVRRQLIFVGIGLVCFVVSSLIDYRLLKTLVPAGYIISVLALVAVLFTRPVNGAQSWFQLGFVQIQPSEIGKVALILTLAAVLAPAHSRGLSWRRLLLAVVLAAIPMALIFRQPDFGTMMVWGFIALIMLYAGGASMRQFFLLTASAIAGGWALFQARGLADYQMSRLTSFLDPTADPQQAGWNRLQSELAIGSGDLFGKGLFHGTQTELSYVPSQPTDFIFTAVGEQLGFVGAGLVLVLFLVIVWRLLVIAARARDAFGGLIAVGVAAFIVVHTFVNVGMTIGIMPVTGLPLPFMSYGGSFYVTTAIALGLAHSVWRRRTPVPGNRFLD
jgi:rod shape determining protein RodA